MKHQTTIYLTEEMRKNVKIQCAIAGKKINQFIEQAIEEKLNRDREELKNG